MGARRLTQIGCEKAKPSKQNALGELVREEMPDDVVLGLYFVLQPSGVKSWAYRYRFAGRPAKHTLGPFGSADQPGKLTISAARDAARAAADDVERGIDPAGGKHRGKRNAAPEIPAAVLPSKLTKGSTVADAWAVFQAVHVEVSAKASLSKFKRVWENQIKPAVGTRAIGSMVKADITPITDKAITRGPSAKNTTIMVCSSFFNWAVNDRGVLDVSPVTGIAKVKTQRRKRALKDHEIAVFLKGCALLDAEETSAVRFGQMFRLMLLTGARRSTVARIKRSDVDLVAKVWTIPSSGRDKNKDAPEVALTDTAIAILKSLPQIKGCPYFFSANGKTAASGFSKAKRALDKVAPLAHYTLHDLRRTFRSGLSALGVRYEVAERAIGHSLPELAKVYDQHDFKQELRKAWLAWDKHVAKLAPKVPVASKPRPIGQRGPWVKLLREDGPKAAAGKRQPEAA